MNKGVIEYLKKKIFKVGGSWKRKRRCIFTVEDLREQEKPDEDDDDVEREYADVNDDKMYRPMI